LRRNFILHEWLGASPELQNQNKRRDRMKKIMLTASAFLFSLALTTGAFAEGGGYGAGATDQQQTQQGAGATQQGQFNVMSSDDLIGTSVMGLQDEEIGSISDILIDVETGQAAFAVVSANGVLGIGADQYLVPWAALEMGPEAEDVRLAISSDRLQQAPTGETVADRQEAEQIHQFYGVAPYWESQPGQQPQMQMEQQDDPMMRDQQQEQRQEDSIFR
jgi:sporulation protein YlmC with PRC-barrel domain